MVNKKIGFLVNDFELKDDQATTFLLRKISSFVDNMYLFSVHDFREGQQVRASLLDVSIENETDIKFNISSLDENLINLSMLDMIIIRTNPARDYKNHHKHANALDVLEKLEKQGIPIINSPRSLKKMHDKSYLFELPKETVPKGALIKDKQDLLRFYNDNNSRIVLKPLVGTRGEGVLLIDTKQKLRDIEEFPILAQEFVVTQDNADKRVCLFDGEVLEIEGVQGVVKRVPKHGEFRSNVCLGAVAEPCELTEQDIQTINQVRPWLIKEKLRYVGLDLLAGKIIEINCFSPGGIQDYERFYKKPFGDYLIGSFLEELSNNEDN